MSMLKPFCAALAAALAPLTLFADVLPAPSGPVVLTISGDLENTTDGVAVGTVTLDMEILEAMDAKVFTTSTLWLEGEIEFTGVSLRDVLAYAGARSGLINAVASNDYKVAIHTNDLEADAPIVAYLMDGKRMPARGKGPLWVVYPYDSDAKYRSEVVYSRSIWQLDRIQIND